MLDLYSKIVVSVIAVALVVIAWNAAGKNTANAAFGEGCGSHPCAISPLEVCAGDSDMLPRLRIDGDARLLSLAELLNHRGTSSGCHPLSERTRRSRPTQRRNHQEEKMAAV